MSIIKASPPYTVFKFVRTYLLGVVSQKYYITRKSHTTESKVNDHYSRLSNTRFSLFFMNTGFEYYDYYYSS